MKLIKPTSILPAIFLPGIILAQDYSQLASSAIPGSLLTPFNLATSYSYDTTTLLHTSGSYTNNATAQSSSATSTPASFIGITGASPSSPTTAAATSADSTRTSTSARPQNTQACNGFVELCNRKLSNVSLVVAHNSPFVVPHNAASNQALGVTTQLENGIRGLQFETHLVNGTMRLCHTSCDLLDVGPLEDYLVTVKSWLDANPFEVIAIMMGNDDRVDPTNYTAPFENAGMLSYLYEPTESSYTLDQWPTLAEMILTQKRVLVMLDYDANQDSVPWLLDMFAYEWQTPFSPTNPAFPCTEQRPPNEAEDVSRNKMYLANHNLNIPIEIGSMDILIPAYSLLEQVNAVSGNASLGRMVENCTAMWGRPPNWLLVDYYNFGNFNGSVFQVAATANNVTYNKDSCCGSDATSAAPHSSFVWPGIWLGTLLTIVLL